MLITKKNINRNFNTIGVSPFWNYSDEPELKMHKIHSYPAKFPSLMVSKSLEYAKSNGIKINSISDVFCGCGTTALEAKRNNLDFWGCDINPVATLIATVKSKQYNEVKLSEYFNEICTYFNENDDLTNFTNEHLVNNERINYWFHQGQIQDLSKLLIAITSCTPKGKYRDFFYVAFSNILKKSSRWLMRSIKPQIDPDKQVYNVLASFKSQFNLMLKANKESIENFNSKSTSKIVTKNFLNHEVEAEFVDMVVTSPPYVTSYEYADLHQLSTLWLSYTDDFRTFRNGTIGSLFHQEFEEKGIENLPKVGKKIHNDMLLSDKHKAKSVAKYFVDMDKVVGKVYKMINSGGIAVFVIGNTKYKEVEIDNAKFLSSSMLSHGFDEIEVAKRKISSKILSPYRDKNGRFSSNTKDKKVYSHEFVLIGRKH